MKKNNLSIIINELKKNNCSLKIDSREIKKGDIFVALKGLKDHGYNYIENAVKQKAKYVISEKYNPKYKNKIFKVNNCLETIRDIANYKRKIYKGKIIGITGSVGKTSTKEQLGFFLNHEIQTYFSIKSYNNLLGVLLSLSNLDLKSKVAIFEIGTNQFGEIKNLTSIIKPHIAIITNIGPSHLKFFKNIKNVEKEKSEILSGKDNPNINSIIIPDNNVLYRKAKYNKNCQVYKFGGKKNSNTYIIETKKIDNFIYKVSAKIINKDIIYYIKANGEHQIINSLITLIVFKILNLNSLNFIKHAKSLPQLSGRGRSYILSVNRKKIVLIDESYNANPMSMKATIEYFNSYKKNNSNKKILILGDMLELGKFEKKLHIQLNKYINFDKVDLILTCGDLIKNLSIYFSNNKKIIHFNNTKEIQSYLLNILDENDIILTKCSNSTQVNKFTSRLKNEYLYKKI